MWVIELNFCYLLTNCIFLNQSDDLKLKNSKLEIVLHPISLKCNNCIDYCLISLKVTTLLAQPSKHSERKLSRINVVT